MKQFNLDEYLKNPSRKVVTGEGRSVKIICTDYYGKQPIIAKEEGSKYSYSFCEDGRAIINGKSPCDLFFAPEKHEGWVNLYKNFEGFIVPSRIYQTKEDAEKRGSTHDCYVATTKIEWEE